MRCLVRQSEEAVYHCARLDIRQASQTVSTESSGVTGHLFAADIDNDRACNSDTAGGGAAVR